MTRRPAPSAFKLEPPVAAARPGPAAPSPAAAPVPTPASPPAAKARGATVPAGCKAVTFYPSKDAHLQLRLLAGRAERTANDLLLDALDLLFAEHRLSRIARPAKPPVAAVE